MTMPSGPFAHVCLLVKDLDAAVEHWSKILGVLDPGQVEQQIVRYDDFEGGEDKGMKWATFVSDHGAEIQFIQPGPGTPLGDRLEKKGEHVHHICLTTKDVPGSLQKLREQGIDTVGGISQDPNMTWQEWGWVSPKHAHGVLVEVAKPYMSKNDGKWYPAD
ncbi:VOC family protein [Mesobacterium pallidum]|uniref:VOC family protein n=1 Tax=Mesobacterium pallidum TaxID=2872037 RepID=UPI00300CBE6E